ncbi:MAG TPA: hypothetical protein PLL36_06790 [Candidatus Hydrogenedentes bacterium]|nr:hypothetical protein [Candidatus Hydrogenedentota bacterium]
MKTSLTRFVAFFLAAVLMLALPVPQCRADEDSETEEIGEKVAGGIALLLLAVLVIVGFRQDMERRAEAALPVLPKTADPKIFVDMDEPPASESEMETAATRIGVQMSF